MRQRVIFTSNCKYYRRDSNGGCRATTRRGGAFQRFAIAAERSAARARFVQHQVRPTPGSFNARNELVDRQRVRTQTFSPLTTDISTGDSAVFRKAAIVCRERMLPVKIIKALEEMPVTSEECDAWMNLWSWRTGSDGKCRTNLWWLTVFRPRISWSRTSRGYRSARTIISE